jgi:hypothetical protein
MKISAGAVDMLAALSQLCRIVRAEAEPRGGRNEIERSISSLNCGALLRSRAATPMSCRTCFCGGLSMTTPVTRDQFEIKSKTEIVHTPTGASIRAASRLPSNCYSSNMGKTLVIWSAIAAFLVVSPTIGRAEVDRETGELIATMLNLNGSLCASVVDFR